MVQKWTTRLISILNNKQTRSFNVQLFNAGDEYSIHQVEYILAQSLDPLVWQYTSSVGVLATAHTFYKQFCEEQYQQLPAE